MEGACGGMGAVGLAGDLAQFAAMILVPPFVFS